MALLEVRRTSSGLVNPGPRLSRFDWPGQQNSGHTATLALRRFLVWWTGALRASLPGMVVRALTGPSEELEVEPGPDTTRFQFRRDGVTRIEGELTLPPDHPDEAPAERLRSLLGRDPGTIRQVTLLLPRDQVLLTEIEPPLGAGRNLGEVLASEMNRHTPFPAADVYFDHSAARPDTARGRLRIALLVARQRDVDAWLRYCESLALKPQKVTCAALPAGLDASFNLLPVEYRRAPTRLLPRIVAAAVIVTFALAAAFLGLWYEQQRTLLQRTEEYLTTLRTVAAEANAFERYAQTLLDRHNRLALMKRAQPQALAVIDAATRSLPDDTWLTALSIHDDALAIEGFSDDSARALRLMAKDRVFADVRFAGPVQTDPRMGQERFRFAARIAPPNDTAPR